MQEEKRESNIDIKGTMKKFIEADEPELEQEEAIMKYEETKNKKTSSSGSDTEENSEEQEHLKRVKTELIASLKRVEQLEKKVFKEDVIDEKVKKNNVKVSNGGKSSSIKIIEEVSHESKEKVQKERE